MNGLDLFSGIGGISKALEQWVRPIAYCEIDPYCQGVLLSRMETDDLPEAAIWDDIKTFRGDSVRGYIDIITGGFPCQGISVAGHGKGLADERSGLFFEIVRLAKEIKPRFIFLENVPAITSRGGLQVVREITEMGYDCRWCVISAASVGAMHKRDRWFLLGYSKYYGSFETERRRSIGKEFISGRSCESAQKETQKIWESKRASGISADVAYSEHKRCFQSEFQERSRLEKGISKGSSSLCHSAGIPSIQADKLTISKLREGRACGNDRSECWPFESRDDWQKTVSEMGKCTDGISYHMDRLRALGNAAVPQQVKKAFKILMGLK